MGEMCHPDNLLTDVLHETSSESVNVLPFPDEQTVNLYPARLLCACKSSHELQALTVNDRTGLPASHAGVSVYRCVVVAEKIDQGSLVQRDSRAAVRG